MDFYQTNSGVFASGDAASALAVTNSLYNAVLLAPEPVKVSAEDTWGNLKIPRLSTVSNVTTLTDGWATVPTLTSPENFTTLVGLPIARSSSGALSSTNFSIEYSYMELQCSPDAYISPKSGTWTHYLGQVWSSTNGSKVFYNNVTQDQTSFFLDTNLEYDTDRVTPAYENQNTSTLQDSALQARRNILFGSEYYGTAADNTHGYAVFFRNCTVWTEYIEAEVQCDAQTCGVTAIRPSVQFADRNTNLTPFDLFQISSYLFKDLPLATGSLHVSDAAPSELFIRGVNTPFVTNSSSIPDITTIPSDTFASRLALLLNTYYLISTSPLSFIGNLPDPEDSSWNLVTTSAYPSSLEASFLAMNATTSVTTNTAIYACNYVWFALLLASSSVLLLTGLTGTMLKYKCLAPDMMGYAASLTYNNPHAQLPSGGGALSAMERARLLKDIPVKIGDANMHGDVGHVVFATTCDEAPIGKLSRSKTYL